MHHWGEFFSTKIHKTQTGFCTNFGKNEFGPQSSYFVHGLSCLSQQSIFKLFCCNIESMKEMFCFPPGSPSQHFLSTLSFFFLLCFQASPFEKEKNPGNKNQGWEPIHQKCKANENTSRHNPKKKQKKTISKNHVKILCKEDPWL